MFEAYALDGLRVRLNVILHIYNTLRS